MPAGATVSRDFATFQALQLPLQAKLLAQKLRSERHLLILDNLESVTGDPLAIQHTLPAAEQSAIRAFLADLLDGATLVLLGSRGGAQWLRPGWKRAEAERVPTGREAEAATASTSSASAVPAPLRDIDIYPLPGLDAGAAADLAERILTRQVADETKRRAYAADPAFTRLIKLLDGSPLALEVVLSNLARQTPAAIVAALEAGDVALDATRNTQHESRTTSILASIAYSHSNLSSDAQRLLLCLAPFTGVINRKWLPQYSAQLQQQPALGDLPFERWEEVVDEAINWGLLVPDGQLDGYLRVQPILPYFLRTRLQEEADLLQSVEMSFYQHYNNIGDFLQQSIQSTEPDTRQIGLVLTRIEYENLSTSLMLALRDQREFFNQYEALFRYLLAQSAHEQCARLSEQVLNRQKGYVANKLSDDVARHFLLVADRASHAYLMTKAYSKAKQTYEDSLTYISQLPGVTAEFRATALASVHHNLGMVAEEQRAWAQAEAHYQQALEIYIEFNDRYSQASTYHQLGRVAEEQEQWDQARSYFLTALQTYHEFGEQHNLNIVYTSLARLNRAGGDATLPAAVAAVLGVDVATVEARFAEALGADEDEA